MKKCSICREEKEDTKERNMEGHYQYGYGDTGILICDDCYERLWDGQ